MCLFVDIIIAGIMIYSVSIHFDDQSCFALSLHVKLRRSQVLCGQFKRRITRLVYIIVGTNILTGQCVLAIPSFFLNENE